jgi:MoaA/NifB/PqqE/SkfB family radical SAM enzyme
MQINITRFKDFKDFDLAYKDTILSNCKYLDIKAPLSVQFELTSSCNQKCIFCYNIWKHSGKEKNSVKLSKEQHFRVIDKIIENEIFDIIFSGGEPLIVEWIDELIERCSIAKMSTFIITNGILLTKEKAEKLKKSGLNGMQISLHHFDGKTNDKLTGQIGSFDKTVNGIKNALLMFDPRDVNINMVALPETYKDVYDMGLFLHSIGVASFSVGSPSVSGEMEENKNLVINKKMFLEVYNQLIRLKNELNIDVGITGGFPICLFPELNSENLKMISNYCDAGLNQLVIDSEGKLRPCVCLGNIIGDIFSDD